MKLICYYVY